MDEATTSIPVERIRKVPLGRIGLVGAAAAALLAVGILAAGTSAAPASTLAAAEGGAGSPVSAVQPGADLPDGPGGLGPEQMREMGGHPGGPGGPLGPGGRITITAISGSNVSLATDDGWTRTITVDSGTKFEASGAAAALADLKVGDEVRFRETRETNGAFTIDGIAVIPPHVGGMVSALSDTSITVTHRDGSSITFTINAATVYDVNGASGTLASLKTGMVLMARGTEDAGGHLMATHVRAADPGQFKPGQFWSGRHGPGNG